MAGFTLGGSTTSTTTHHHPSEVTHDQGFFLYRSNEEISNSNKGFELWHDHLHHHHQQQQQQQQRHIYQESNHYLTSSSSRPSDQHDLGPSSSSRVGANMLMMRSSQGGVSCQDCGNQAKKDCLHMRCRSCCKSRNLPCQTHVKSTWVPASRRRERQQQLASLHQQQQQQQQQRGGRGESSSTSAIKRPRENMMMNMNNMNNSSSSALASSGGLEEFPAEVNTQAVFRCVRVSSMVDNHSEDHQPLQYAYQAAVNIGGHVFKGILYDQGLEAHYETSSGTAAAAAAAVEVNTTRCLMTSNAETAATTAMNVNGGGAALIDPSSMYPTPLNAFVAGTQFFGHPRS
ncbi:hypothetical protein Sjap_017001 [Stephania japonica]|uniref:Uncharacterized protein n=1 Tax=Stephania japonica TaxID=461633 RepID=A0AAP0NLH9_9MAGN